VKSVVSIQQPVIHEPAAADAALVSAVGKISGYISLTKPRILAMVLVTVGVGYLVGAKGHPDGIRLALVLAGTGLVAGGASALNQWLERDRDARMRRTSARPLPSGRLTPREAAVFGAVLGVGGTALLVLAVDSLAAAVAFLTFVLYVFVYTPLKPQTTLNTAAGAVPGALPPVIGWVAATHGFGVEAAVLFLILFFWQFPHFLAIAWIFRDDYARGGMRMLPHRDPRGVLTGGHSTAYALALLPVGLLPAALGFAGMWYFAGALVLGVVYLLAAVRFWWSVSDLTARALLRTSILYLPIVLLLLVLNPVPA